MIIKDLFARHCELAALCVQAYLLTQADDILCRIRALAEPEPAAPPIDPEDERVVDALVSRKTAGAKTRPLTQDHVPPEVHERGWQWRPVGDGAFAPPFGTIRKCIDCGCLVAGGPSRCGMTDATSYLIRAARYCSTASRALGSLIGNRSVRRAYAARTVETSCCRDKN